MIIWLKCNSCNRIWLENGNPLNPLRKNPCIHHNVTAKGMIMKNERFYLI